MRPRIASIVLLVMNSPSLMIRPERIEFWRDMPYRLHDRMPLGMDSTIRYGLHVPGTKPLLQSDLDSNNPYNSRKFLGLPPTPIANPGLPSIEAAAHPAHVDYLYFVRKPDHRHHYFTSNYNDFVNHEHLYGY